MPDPKWPPSAVFAMSVNDRGIRQFLFDLSNNLRGINSSPNRLRSFTWAARVFDLDCEGFQLNFHDILESYCWRFLLRRACGSKPFGLLTTHRTHLDVCGSVSKTSLGGECLENHPLRRCGEVSAQCGLMLLVKRETLKQRLLSTAERNSIWEKQRSRVENHLK